jgi:hypothetical protein
VEVPPSGGRAVWCTSRVVVLRSYITRNELCELGRHGSCMSRPDSVEQMPRGLGAR